MSIPQIFCENHPEEKAIRFCTKHQDLVCRDCIIDRHSNHGSECKEINHETIDNFLQQGLEKLNKLQQQILSIIEQIILY